MLRSRTGRGFTLVELLLAMGISAFVAALAYAGITTAIGASEGMQMEVRRLDELQRALGILEDDLMQVRPRGITNGFGSQEPAFRGGNFQDALLEFTRGGRADPLGLPRSDLQRVRYVLEQGRLWRQTWATLDRSDESVPPQSVLLLEGVEHFDIVFLSKDSAGAANADYYTLASGTAFTEREWDARQVADDAASPLPAALSMSFTVNGFGEVRRVIELP